MNITKFDKTIEEIYQILDQSKEYLNDIDELISLTKFIHSRIKNPRCYITFVGETSSGKSTLINILIGKNLLPTFARPTTGTVTEIEFSSSREINFSVIYKDGNKHKIDYETFKKLSENPTENLLRLYVNYPSFDYSLNGLTIIDTPGYNGINVEHEKILKDFLPNSDIIVYVIGYKQGFGQYDLEISKLIKDKIEENSEFPIFVIINRIPDNTNFNDKRVIEILSTINTIFGRNFPTFLIPSLNLNSFSDNKNILSYRKELLGSISKVALNTDRLNHLIEKHLNILEDMLEYLDNEFDLILNLQRNRQNELQNILNEFRLKENLLVEIVEKEFAELLRIVTIELEKKIEESISKIEKELENFSSWTQKQEAFSYIFNHRVRFEIEKISREILDLIYNKLKKLDEEIEDFVNTAIMELEKNIYMIYGNSEYTEKIINKISKRWSIKLVKYLLAVKGGVGGYAAGIGNIVKKLVSKVGKIFGKTFSASTYARIGKFFNKTRTNIIIQGAIEAIFYIKDSLRFKLEVIKKVKKCFNDWKVETLKDIKDSLEQNKFDTTSKIKVFFSECVKLNINENQSIKLHEIERIKDKIEKLRLALKEV